MRMPSFTALVLSLAVGLCLGVLAMRYAGIPLVFEWHP